MKEPGLRPFAGLDLRRPKGYTAASTATAVTPAEEEVQGDPCPRCESRDTKFCYYNNYNTSQPRHYCKSCRRYWTKGGTLRNVPVGGGSRKSSSSSSSSSSSAASPKCAKNSKRRRVALAAPPEPEASTTDIAGAAHTEATANNGTIGDPATAEAAAQTEATVNDTVDDPAIAADEATTETATTEDQTPAEDDDVTAGDPTALPAADGGFSDHPSVELGLAVADAGGKEAPDLSPFEWPSGCDLGFYWAPDPVLFFNLP